MGRLARHLCDFLFPPRCSVCGDRITDPASGRAMCHVCYEKYGAEVRAGCAVCGRAYPDCICHPEPFFPDDFVFALPYNKMGGVCRKLFGKLRLTSRSCLWRKGSYLRRLAVR